MSPRARRQVVAVSIFLVVVVAFSLTYRMAIVSGDSMTPTFKDGQLVLVARRRGWSGSVKKGDVILFKTTKDVLVKRVAYLPGEIIRGTEAFSFRRVRDYFEVKHIPPTETSPPMSELKVPANVIVVLGDNPGNSDDSRSIGTIPMRDIIGYVVNAPPR